MEDYNLLYDQGLLKLKAEEKSGSRSRKLDGESNLKRAKISQEECREKITGLSTEIELLKEQIATKQNIITKANTVKDFQLCNKTQMELRNLLKDMTNVKYSLLNLKIRKPKVIGITRLKVLMKAEVGLLVLKRCHH